MIPKASSLVALCGTLAFATLPACAGDARPTSGAQSATTWTAPAAATPLVDATTANADDNATPDELGLFTVPEPATLAMFAAGLLGIAGIGHRWRRR